MPLSDHARWRVVLRTAGTVVAVVSAGIAIWLIVTGTTAKTTQAGVIVGLWAALLGSVTLLGTRRGTTSGEWLRRADLDRVVSASTQAARGAAQQAAEQAAARVADQTVEVAREAATHAAQESAQQAADDAVARALAAAQEANAGRELERRRTAEVERERDEAARREFALSLELMLRREMERTLREELDALRQEVAGLRNDLTEKVPGQIRLERIETTRLIGSDLEALQAEVRRLAEERLELGGRPAGPLTYEAPAGDPAPVASPTPAATGIGRGHHAMASAEPGRDLDRDLDVQDAEIVEDIAPVAPVAGQPARVDPAATPTATPGGVPPLRVVPPPVPSTPPPSSPASTWSTPTVSTPAATRPSPAPPAASPASASAPAPAVEPAPAASAEPTPSPTPSRGADLFAGLPRLSRWTDPFESEHDAPVGPTTSPTPVADDVAAAAGVSSAEAPAEEPAAGSDTESPRYVGRRRQPGETEDAPDTPGPTPEHAPAVGGRRRAPDDDPGEAVGGRRRRRADERPGGGHSRGDGLSDDVLARLLGR